MDKYEYQVCADQIKLLISERRYTEAMNIADTIDWRKVRSVSMLQTVSEVYKINKKYEEARDILLLAYDRYPNGRTIVYALCELAIKLNDVLQAKELYEEFVILAPEDTSRYILLYKLYEALDVSIEERIEVLEEFKKRDYREKWAYELAYLYHKIGQETRCVEECDELILWFGDGRYVKKAMELKMQHTRLSKEQQSKYEGRKEPMNDNFMKLQQTPVQQIYDTDPQAGNPQQIPQPQPYGGQYGQGYMNTDPSQQMYMGQGQMPVQIQQPGQDMKMTVEPAATAVQRTAQMLNTSEIDSIQVQPVNVGMYNTIDLQNALSANISEFFEKENANMQSSQVQLSADPEAFDQQLYENDTMGFTTGNGPVIQVSMLSPAANEMDDVPGEEDDTQITTFMPINAELVAGGEDEQAKETAVPMTDAGVSEQTAYTEGYANETAYTGEMQAVEEQAVEDQYPEGYYTGEMPAQAVEEQNAGETGEQAEEGQYTEEYYAGDANEQTEQEPEAVSPEDTGSEDESEEINEEVPQKEKPEYELDEEDSNDQELDDIYKDWEDKKKENEERRIQEAKEKSLIQTSDIMAQLKGVLPEIDDIARPTPPRVVTKEDTGEMPGIEPVFKPYGNTSAVREVMPATVSIPVPADVYEDEEPEEEKEPIDFAAAAKEPEEEPEDEDLQDDEPVEDVPVEENSEEEVTEEEQEEETESSEAGPEAQDEEESEALESEPEEDEEEPENSEYEPETDEDEPETSESESEDEEYETSVSESEEVSEEAKEENPEEEPVKEEEEADEEPAEEADTVNTEEESSEPETEEEDEDTEEELQAEIQDAEAAPDEEPEEDPAEDPDNEELEDTKESSDTDREDEEPADTEESINKESADEEPADTENTEEPGKEPADMVIEGTGEDEYSSMEISFDPDEDMNFDTDKDEGFDPEKLEVSGSVSKGEFDYLNDTDIKSNDDLYFREIMNIEESEEEVFGGEKAETTGEKSGDELTYTEDEEAARKAAFEVTSELPKYPYEGLDDYGEVEEIEVIEQPEGIDGIMKTSDIPLDAIAQANYEAGLEVDEEEEEEKAPKKKSKKKHPSYMKEPKEKVSKRDFDKEEQLVFGRFEGIQWLKAEIVNAIDNVSMEPSKGNVIVMGSEAAGRRTIAIDIVKVMQKLESEFKGKVAKISGEALNKKDIPLTLKKLRKGALIIENAGGLTPSSARIVAEALELETEPVLVVMEGDKEGIQKLLDSSKKIMERVFNARIELQDYTTDDLVAYGKGYARELEYTIDEMGVLALYRRIGDMQTLEHTVTLEEVREIIDNAIKHVDKKNMSHFMDVILAKRYDDDDYIILREKDFIT